MAQLETLCSIPYQRKPLLGSRCSCTHQHFSKRKHRQSLAHRTILISPLRLRCSVLFTSSFCVIAFSSLSLITLFLVNSSNIAVNAGRFFVLTGLTLFLDDLPDVSKRVELTLNKIKSGFYKIRKGIHVFQLITGVVTFYVFIAILLDSIHKFSLTVSNFLTMSTLLITSITSFACVKRKAWLKITPACATQKSH